MTAEHLKWRLIVADKLHCRPSGLDSMAVAELNMLIAWEAWKAEESKRP